MRLLHPILDHGAPLLLRYYPPLTGLHLQQILEPAATPPTRLVSSEGGASAIIPYTTSTYSDSPVSVADVSQDFAPSVCVPFATDSGEVASPVVNPHECLHGCSVMNCNDIPPVDVFFLESLGCLP